MDHITTDHIKEHRQKRKDAGLAGCKNGDDAPLTSIRGMSWRPADPMNPECFCHDCRTTWDPDGTIDLELIRRGHRNACWVYDAILPNKVEKMYDLRRKTDDAFENVVRQQMAVEFATDAVESVKEQLDIKRETLSRMTRGKDYGFLKQHGAEIDDLERRVCDLELQLEYHIGIMKEAQEKYLDAKVRHSAARREEREYTKKIL